MIIRLTKANFSSNNIGQYTTEPGTLTFNVSPSNATATLTCAAMSPSTKTGTGTITWANIPAGSTVSYEVSLSGYNTQKGSISIYGNTSKTITLSEVGSVTPPVTPDPETPTMYTFTINPTPTNATVTLTASGYSQSGKSITVPANTNVTWKVSASGYTEQNGTHTVTKTETKNVTLSAVSGGGTSGESIDLSTLSLNHCSSSKIGTGNKENLVYNNETHALTCNSTGWYKCSYFTTPVTEGMEIEFESNASKSITGNFYGIWAEDELVDGISEVNGSFWPAASFGVYASGGTTSSTQEPLYLWSTTAKKLAIGEYLADAMNGKTVKYIIRNTGIEVYIDNTKLDLPLNTVLDSSKTYYFGMRHSCSNSSTQCSKMLYMGPIR